MNQAVLKAQTLQRLRDLNIDPQVIAHRTLPYFEEVSEHLLVDAEMNADTGKVYRLISPAAQAWRAMQQQAAADGVGIYLVSAYRSLTYQTELIRAKQGAYGFRSSGSYQSGKPDYLACTQLKADIMYLGRSHSLRFQ